MERKLYALSKSENLGRAIAVHANMPLLKTKLETFADGEICPIFEESVRNTDLTIIAQLQLPYTNLMELIFTCDAARRNKAREISVVIPYLPHSRQERRGKKRAAISARTIADMLQNAGVNHIISMDLHIDAIEGFYDIPFDKLQPTEVIANRIKDLSISNLHLVSPDFGFIKKMEEYQDILDVDMSVIRKRRTKANKIDKMELIGDVKGKNVVIIDDIIDTAGTLVKASDLLIDKGATSVTVFATHGVLSGNYNGESTDNAIHKIANSNITKVYITNTIERHPEIYDSNKTLDVISDSKQLAMWAMSNNKINFLDVSKVFATAIQNLNRQ